MSEENEYTNPEFVAELYKELSEFKKEILLLDKESIYESYYKIHTYEEIAGYLIYYEEMIQIDKLPKTNILHYVYEEYMDSDGLGLSYEDIGYLMENVYEDYEHYYKKFENEM